MSQSENSTNQNRPSSLVSFFRHNLVAILATGIDFLTLIILTEVIGLWYMASTVIAAIAGAITAFLLGRYWVFVSLNRKVHEQALRYTIVAIGSVLLNSSGVYLFTEYLCFQYLISKGFTSILVGVGYNYLLGKYFVFK